MDIREKIDLKIKEITSGSKYGLYPDGLSNGEIEEKLKSAKKWNPVFLVSMILLVGFSIIILLANILEIVDLNQNLASLLFILSFSLLAQYFRFRNRIKSLDMASFLYKLKKEASDTIE